MKNKLLKRVISCLTATALTASMLSISAVAEEVTTKMESYPYTLFTASTNEGAITVNAGNFCINGNVATNGTIISTGNINVNGTKTENAGKEMIYIFDKIDSQYFSDSTANTYDKDYTYSETNITIDIPTEVEGETILTGNININTALKSLENINLYGEVKNTNDSVIFSKYGDIIIDSSNVNLNGLVYAPFGDVEITAQNLNLNNVVIIADTITFNCPNVNANFSDTAASFVGTTSEEFFAPYDEWIYLDDTDSDGLPDLIEKELGSDPENSDTDGDGLPDGYEVLTLATDPTKADTDENGVSDADEDFDEDGLTNLQEYQQNTEPYNDDTDGDGLLDGEEVNTYFTDPLKADTDEDGLEGGVTGELTIISCDNPIAGHGFLIYRSYINDKFNFAKLTGGYEFGEWEFINTSTLTAYIYEMKPYDYVSIGNAGTHAMGGIGSSGSSGGGGLENSEDINDGDCGGMYFNREFAYDYLHYDGTDYKSGYSKNYSYTKAITSKGINEVIKCAKDNNYYNLPQHNCVHVAIISWNSVFPTDSFDEHTFPLGLKNEIKGRDGSRVFDILTEVLGF